MESLGFLNEGSWSCRGCGLINSPIQYRCLLCPKFSLCLECHKNPTQHHTKHEPHCFALVTASESYWECNECGDCNGNARAKCRSCEDVDFCLKCFNRGLSKIHPEHPKKSDFGWYIYDDSGWVCDGCNSRDCDLGFNCSKCRDFILCPKCIGSAHEHHKLHPDPQTYTPVIALSRDWVCDFCEKPLEKLTQRGLGAIRYQCNHCEDFTLCSKCVEKAPRKHKEHPQLENFTAVLYVDNQTPTYNNSHKSASNFHIGLETIKTAVEIFSQAAEFFADDE
ncbi:hypothetical protein RSOLAG1IB_03855 [Rhizoctonia solani AG-1 IB]|uniref:RanBP2-type domain-containing protein n=1 Tax=Thanatephorus cucumeris (strain AG1-IB / isolate 7/3/14) TaxID=1108050 RepID=A0A0B7FWS5_THACB|nr:hypothetical protein RSOLAG1IB_03855 [Rhizoctonia solani AG-1 IB]